MNPELERLAETLRSIAHRRPLFFLPGLGNWGDGLIRSGTLQFFSQIRLEVTEIEHVSRGKRWLPWNRKGSLIYGGGGAWCHYWNQGAATIARVGHLFEEVVVLPSTFELPVDLPRVHLFARDRFESQAHAPDAIFCHDMAFCLGPQNFPPGNGIGWFLRTDKESAHRLPIGASNRDISTEGSHLSPPEGFLSAVAQHQVIHTDRLHVAIAACLLGRELHLYPGGYFKNRALFRSSIEGRFPNTCFHEE